MLKLDLKKIILALSLVTAVAFEACSSDNPIEIENDKISHDFGFDSDVLEKNLDKADLHVCAKKYGKVRCENFKERYGAYDCDEIADSTIGDDGEPLSSSSVESSSSAFPYLLQNMQLKITLKSYKQVAKSMSEDDSVGDPEIRFAVKYFSDGIQVRVAETEDYIVSPILLQEKNMDNWVGSSNTFMDITRGIDEIRLCPMVIDKDENESAEDSSKDVDISSGECYAVTEIGYLTETVELKDATDLYDIEWSIELHEN